MEAWYSGEFPPPPQMRLVILSKVLSKRLKENQLFNDTEFRKMLIILMFPIANSTLGLFKEGLLLFDGHYAIEIAELF